MIQPRLSILQKQCREKEMDLQVLSAQIVVASGVSIIDEVIGGFKAGETTYVYGESPLLHYFPYYLCVQTYMMFHGTSVFLDGGSSLNPYTLARYAKSYELNAKDVLKHVRLSRAFTMYQLSSIVYEHLESFIEECKPQTLIVQSFPLLYHDNDVSFDESSTLFKETLKRIDGLTKQYNLITLLTNPMNHWMPASNYLHESLFSSSDELISIHQMRNCPRIFLPCHQQSKTVTSGVRGQLCLQDFGMVV